LIRKKIAIAFEQRNAKDIPKDTIDVLSFNSLMFELARKGLWRYQNVSDANEMVRAMRYSSAAEQMGKRDPQRLQQLTYDAIYVDEGQDFFEEEFRLLKDLCRVGAGGEPNLYVFYDDAQNVYARRRPNWQSIGINVRGGRSFVMSHCFRNTRPIVEATFNVLYGTCAGATAKVPSKEFGDISTLQEKGLIVSDNGFWRVKFATRDGAKPRLTIARNIQHEDEMLIERLRWLIGTEQVRPEDIQVLAWTGNRLTALAEKIQSARIPTVDGIQLPFAKKEKDELIGRKNRLTLSTVQSAKGYDAYCVLLVSANDFKTDVEGRATFYVGCTRAIEYLEVFAYERKGLVVELEAALTKVQT
jgi:superfamily I DNA/RNA helicase